MEKQQRPRDTKKEPEKPIKPVDLTSIVQGFIMPGVVIPVENSGGEPNDMSGSNGFVEPKTPNISGYE